jgi:serine/threonine protein kinase/tetratricopeptide (TPR) repeat protein
MGEVFLAEDTELERQVALKFLPPHYASDPDALERFKREAKAAAALNHPNIVTVYEVGEHERRPFIAMAYEEGVLLGDLLAKGEMSVDRALGIVEQLCEGLGRAHQAGIVHRDIKPANLFINHDGRVKILDFGLSKRAGATRITQQESTLGTLYYMSPEQARGEEVDHRSDIFSVGVVLYELLAGRAPFGGEHSAAVLYAIAHDEPPPLARFNNRVTPELERIVSKALAKKPEDRYQSTADLAVDLKHAYDRPRGTGPTKGRLLKYIVPTSALFVIVILVLLLKPFKLEVSPDQTAVAQENKLAIMYFENMVDPGDEKRLGEIVTDLLITNLSRSEDLRVVSSQRLYDILKLKGHEGVKVLDQTTSTEVARTAGARWMMLGRILQVEPTFIVSSQIIDMESGDVVTSQRVTGAPGETIFDIVDRMTGDTQGSLHIPVQQSVEEVSIADVTTGSLEAYRYYLEGEELSNKVYTAEAREAYRKAIAADSTFAMAYLKFATASGSIEQARAAIDKAMKLANKVSKKEKLYIQARHSYFTGDDEKARQSFEEITAAYPDEKDAYSALGSHYYSRRQHAQAVAMYKKVIEIDPMDKLTYNQLAYAYDGLGDFDQSIWAINKYVELAPGEANPYDTRGDLYAFNGKVDEAIASYDKAVVIKPDFFASVKKLGDMYLYKLDEESAKAKYRTVVAEGQAAGMRSEGRYCLANVSLYRGRFAEGLEQMDRAIAADELEGAKEWSYAQKFFAKSLVHTALGEHDRAIEESEKGMAAVRAFLPPNVPQFSLQFELGRAGSLAQNHRPEEARKIVDNVEATAATSANTNLLMALYLAKGGIALATGDAAAACASFEKARDIKATFQGGYWLARAYLEAGRFDEAIDLFENILRKHDAERIASPTWAVPAHYYLAVAYEKAGNPRQASSQYERFLAIWKDADPRVKEVPEARSRLAALRASG